MSHFLLFRFRLSGDCRARPANHRRSRRAATYSKELGAQEPGSGSFDPFADIEAKYSHDVDAEDETVGDGQTSSDSADDLDEYAKWAAEAAAKATSGEFPAAKAAPKPHKPIPMPVPSALKPKKQD